MSTTLWWQIVSAVLVGACLAVATCLVIARIWPILALFAAGAIIAHLLDPLIDRIHRRGWSRLGAVWIVTLIGTLLLGSFLAWLIPTLVSQIQSVASAWPTYSERATALYEAANTWLLARVENREAALRYQKFLDEQWLQLQDWFAEQFPLLLRHLSQALLRSLTWLFFAGLLVIIIFHFMLVIDRFREGLRSVLPSAARPHVETIAGQMSHLLGQYLRGLIMTAFCVGTFTAAGLGIASLFFGTRHWLLIGSLAGALYVVPWVGGAIAQVMAAFFGYTTALHHGGISAIVAWAIVAAVNQIGDVVLMPRIVGRRVGLHPLAVLFGILAGYKLFGIAGMMLAAPLMASIKIVLAHWLPVKGAPPEERAPDQPLDIDMAATVRKAYESLRGLGRRIEGAISGRGQPGPAVAADKQSQDEEQETDERDEQVHDDPAAS